MPSVCLPTVRALVATPCQYQWGLGPETNKFEQVSSNGHQLLLAGDVVGRGGLMSDAQGTGAKGDQNQSGTVRYIEV